MPRSKTRKKVKWFEKGEPLNWRKTDSQAKRRREALKSRKGDYLATARALMALSNVTTDSKTKSLARSDSYYFFAMHRGRRK